MNNVYCRLSTHRECSSPLMNSPNPKYMISVFVVFKGPVSCQFLAWRRYLARSDGAWWVLEAGWQSRAAARHAWHVAFQSHQFHWEPRHRLYTQSLAFPWKPPSWGICLHHDTSRDPLYILGPFLCSWPWGYHTNTHQDSTEKQDQQQVQGRPFLLFVFPFLFEIVTELWVVTYCEVPAIVLC